MFYVNLNPWFVTGFYEGEGAFTYCRSLSGSKINPRLSITQRFDYDDLIQKLKDFWGMGKIYEVKARGNSKKSVKLVICNQDDLPIVIEHFDRYPIQSIQKKRAYEIWKELIVSKAWSNSSFDETQIRLAKELTTANVRPRGFTTRRNEVML